MNKLIFIINCGSSSIKFAIINPWEETTHFHGLIEKIGTEDVELHYQSENKKYSGTLGPTNHRNSLQQLVPLIPKTIQENIVAIGHRVVHGGEQFTKACLIDNAVIAGIKTCGQLAPLHNPANLLGIEAANLAFTGLPQVAVFDTAFHQTMPPHSYIYPLPYALYQQQGIRRYGFHGISHQYVTEKAAKILKQDLHSSAFLSAHLGNGCSAAAVLNGKSVDTTMGFTPLEGLVMGTRCGDIDPSLVGYLCDTLKLTVHQVTDMLNQQSGLLGISGISMDMRTLSEQSDKPQAKLAIEIFCYRLAKYLAALAVPLGTIDALIFTGGIGENDCVVREKVIDWLKILGFELHGSNNLKHGNDKGIITTDKGPIAMVINTDEQLLIAKETASLLGKLS